MPADHGQVETDYLEKAAGALQDSVRLLETAIKALDARQVSIEDVSTLLLKSRVDAEYVMGVVNTIYEFEGWDDIPEHRYRLSTIQNVRERLPEALRILKSLTISHGSNVQHTLCSLSGAVSRMDAAISWCERRLTGMSKPR